MQRLGWLGAVALVVGTLAGGQALAQSKTLKIIVPYTPGSGPDILSRLMGEQIGKASGPTVVVENRPGGGAMTIGTEAAARARAGRQHRCCWSPTPSWSTWRMKRGNIRARAISSRSAISRRRRCRWWCRPAPWKTVQELVADAKANPGKITFASGGPATSLHIAIEVLRLATKIDINYVPYGGSGPAVTALMGGHVQAVWADYPTVVSQLKRRHAARARHHLAEADRALPGVPIMEETGITEIRGRDFLRLVAPAKTPPQAIKKLSDDAA